MTGRQAGRRVADRQQGVHLGGGIGAVVPGQRALLQKLRSHICLPQDLLQRRASLGP